MNHDFQYLADVALIVFAFCAPLAYCAVHVDGPTSSNNLHLACIHEKGEWKSDSWSAPYTCTFPKSN